MDFNVDAAAFLQGGPLNPRRVVLVFVDGVGLGENDRSINPLAAAGPLFLAELVGGPLIAGGGSQASGTLLGLDALLDTAGLPQSGTGQYSLLTGANGAAAFGRHYGPYVPTALRTPLQTNNLLTRASASGHSVAFANAYPEELFREGAGIAHGPLRAGPPLAALGAGVLTRHTDLLRSGDAIASEIVNTGWRKHLKRDLPEISAGQAGSNLARIANQYDLTLFAHYSTDAAGHAQDLEQGIAAFALFDTFICALHASLDPGALLVVASDHGNLEDVRGGHTRNPALCVVAGEEHVLFAAGLGSLLDVAPAILAHLGGSAPDQSSRSSTNTAAARNITNP